MLTLIDFTLLPDLYILTQLCFYCTLKSFQKNNIFKHKYMQINSQESIYTYWNSLISENYDQSWTLYQFLSPQQLFFYLKTAPKRIIRVYCFFARNASKTEMFPTWRKPMISEVCSLTQKNNPKSDFSACDRKGKKSYISLCW